jgi:hypothetical protein
MNVTRVLSLEAIKGEAGATSKRREKASDQTTMHRSNQIEHTSLRHRHTHTTSYKRPGIRSLSQKACNPYYEHSGARQHEQQQNPLDVGSFMPEPVYILVSALHTIQT